MTVRVEVASAWGVGLDEAMRNQHKRPACVPVRPGSITNAGNRPDDGRVRIYFFSLVLWLTRPLETLAASHLTAPHLSITL